MSWDPLDDTYGYARRMALRRLHGCLLAALAISAGTACKNKGDATKAGSSLDQRCEALAKVCGDSDKHVAKIVEGCRDAAKQQTAKGCADKVIAVYDCYEKELCAKADKVWAFEDFRVLADRNTKCVAERNAATECVGK